MEKPHIKWMCLCLGLMCVVELCSGAEDIFASRCIETNVTTKYSVCFNEEVNILSGRKYTSETQCLKAYAKVANCIKHLGEVCDNGVIANYMRFLYNEYNIEVAGAYACQHLDELRNVVRCVTKYSREIYDCRVRIWYGSTMTSYRRTATTQDLYCWNMGVAVVCRIRSARNCEGARHYFRYLFSVYPTECQAPPYEHTTIGTTRNPNSIDKRECNDNNYLNLFYICFKPEASVTTANITSEATCRASFATFRECTNHLYASCRKVMTLKKVVKDYASPDKMMRVENYACKNWQALKRGTQCLVYYKELIEGCVKTTMKYELDKIRYIQMSDPERAACLVINFEYKCRQAYRYKCPNETVYFEYLDMLYPKCSGKVTPKPTEPCNLKNYPDLYMKCLRTGVDVILDIATQKKSCKEWFFEIFNCLTDLKNICQKSDAASTADAVANPDDFTTRIVGYACRKMADMKLAVYCIEAYKKEISACVAERRKEFNDVCTVISILTLCQKKFAVKHKCRNMGEFFEYKKLLTPSKCSVLPTVPPIRKTCVLSLLYRDLIHCLRVEMAILNDVKITKQQCVKVFNRAMGCFSNALKPCSGKVQKLLSGVFSVKLIFQLREYVCTKLEELMSIAICMQSKLPINFDDDCTKQHDNITLIYPTATNAKHHACRLIRQVINCYQTLMPTCDKNNIFKEYLDLFLPVSCLNTTSASTVVQTSTVNTQSVNPQSVNPQSVAQTTLASVSRLCACPIRTLVLVGFAMQKISLWLMNG